jgi:hypothetical protein
MDAEKHANGTGRYSIRLLLAVIILVSLACALPFGSKLTPTPEAQGPTDTPTLPPPPTPTSQPLPPALIESLPPQGAEVPLRGPITLYFNQAMNRSTVETALRGQFTQKISFNWADEQTVALVPNEPWQP